MYCRFCGADIPDDSKFCQKCGKELTDSNDNAISEKNHRSQTVKHPVLTKQFTSNTFTSNKDIVCEINTWLHNSDIKLISVKILTTPQLADIVTLLMGHHTEIIPNLVEFSYIEDTNTNIRYTMDYISKASMFGRSTVAQVEELFADWKRANPNVHIVFTNKSNASTTNGTRINAIHFIYIEKRNE